MTRAAQPLAGLIVWLAGLTLGTWVSSRAVPPRQSSVVSRPDGTTYVMLAVDFHVHSFPGDGALLPWDVAAEARRRGLDAIALTNHNHMRQWRVLSAMRRWMPRDVIVLAGEEVTSPGFHIAAVGIERPVRWSRSALEVIDAVHALGGLAIAAHPGQQFSQAYDERALAALDAVEAVHPLKEKDDRRRREIDEFYARVRRAHPSIASIGSSDFHREAPIGAGRTFVFVTERTETGILDAVRHARTVACDAQGHTMGRQPWTGLARNACEAAMVTVRRPPARTGGWFNAFAVACAIVGLTAMMRSRP